MATRMLRDYTRSKRVDLLSCQAEIFFVRLIMKADDYGCFYADPGLLRADLYPRKLDKIREADITRWMAECQKAGVIALYESGQEKYLQILDFGQRKRQMNRKFPPPTSDGQPPDKCMLEEEREIEEEVEREVEGVKRKVFKPPALDEVVSYFKENGYSETSAHKAFEYYNEADWHDSQGKKIYHWKQKMLGVWFKPENLAAPAPSIQQGIKDKW